jgi:hypothetical protein
VQCDSAFLPWEQAVFYPDVGKCPARHHAITRRDPKN